MNSKRVINTAELMQPIAHFSHAIRIGNVVHVGATAGTDAARRLAGQTPGLVDASAQIHRMLDNLDTVLGLLGARREHLVRVKAYINDTRDFACYDDIRRARLGDQPPAHAVVGSPGFPLPQAAAELDAVAVVDSAIQRLQDGATRVGPRHYCTALPVDPAGNAVGNEMTSQARAALTRLAAMLNRGGLTPADVVNLHVTLADMRDLPVFEREFASVFKPPYPARTIAAAALPQPGLRVQIESIARAGGGQAIGDIDPTLGCASPAMLAGDELFLSGQIGMTADGRLAHGPQAQTRAAWGRLAKLLGDAGLSRAHVLRTNNLLTDWRNYGEFNAGYGANVAEPYPPRTTAIGGLADPSAMVQIEGLAYAGTAEPIVLTTSATVGS